MWQGVPGRQLANVPEIIDTAKSIKTRLPGCFVFVGGHSASFVAADLLAQGAGAIDCVIEGEGEASIPRLLQAVQDGNDLTDVPGAISVAGEGPPPHFVESLDTIRPARDLLARRRYFIRTLDPCASIEFARGKSEGAAPTHFDRHKLITIDRVDDGRRQDARLSLGGP